MGVLRSTVAALYVEPDGPYANLGGVEVWDEARDARKYDGPWPVIAHPPCNRWSILANVLKHKPWFTVGDDKGCFEAALKSVRRFGGVLEHPAHTLAWKAHGLLRPTRIGWTKQLFDDGWISQVDQAWYGHICNKPTWLYAVGCNVQSFKWGRKADTEYCVGRFRTTQGFPSKKKLLSTQEQRKYNSTTPIPFRDLLLSMARSVHMPTR